MLDFIYNFCLIYKVGCTYALGLFMLQLHVLRSAVLSCRRVALISFAIA